MKLPRHRHIALSIDDTEHSARGLSVDAYLDTLDAPNWAKEGEREKAIATQELWICRWRSDVPGVENVLAAASLDVLLKALAECE